MPCGAVLPGRLSETAARLRGRVVYNGKENVMAEDKILDQADADAQPVTAAEGQDRENINIDDPGASGGDAGKAGKKKKKPGKKKKSSASTIILIIVFIIGLSLLLYPSLSNYWNSFHATRVITDYNEAIANMTEEDFDAYWDAARQYNADLLSTSNRYIMSDEQKARYDSLLNVADDGVMGYIEIPSIRVNLPIYHGVDEDILQHSAGHLPGSSLPVGGEGTHCVLSGHRGLPSAKLFTNLDRLQEGDTFMLNVLNDTLTYEVDQIRIVLPDELYDLEIEPGQDYCTLVTCTPYGINTHRLLVRGHRVETTADAKVSNEGLRVEPMLIAPIIAVPILIVLLIILLFRTRKKPEKKVKDPRTDQEKLRELIDSRIAEEDASLNADANGPHSEPAETPPEPPQSSENDNSK